MSGAIILLLATVFVVAAVSKLRSRAEFSAVLRRLILGPLVGTATIVVPGIEILIAVFLLSGLAPQGAIMAAIVLLSVFTVVLIEMRRRGVKGCACFGESAEDAGTASGIIRNLLLIIAAVCALQGTGPIFWIGPDTSSFLGRVTIVTGAFCLWPCLVALANRRKYLFN
jgi:hypothetical protein